MNDLPEEQFEKRGVVADGWTPATAGQKRASSTLPVGKKIEAGELEDSLSKRLSDAAEGCCGECGCH